ncbi:alpha/beta hydrolase [Microbacterium sp. BG28]|uniref:alpha/beta hydrolase n=1 Tax=Microbacterium sp. BG28 TaxID=3097356 RepID=UPI002A5A285F|nr:alpha/beta hydrolase [Microbacterium sp. BG28]MDY0828503.1 alpha/beta hydrolase [Microbacterium sp. BG28]
MAEPDGPVRPAYDPELEASLRVSGVYVLDFAPENLAAVQNDLRTWSGSARAQLADEGFRIEDATATAPDGVAVPLHHISRLESREPRPCIVYIHGGGMVLGTPWDAAPDFRRWISDFGASVVTIDYRLAPEVTAPSLVEDCYAALCEISARATDWGIDPESLIIAGMSAGGGLAAGVAQLARERGGPPLCGQLLLAPMLDPLADGDSARQLPHGPWNRDENAAAWRLVLGGGDVASAGANAPAHATTLSDLSPAFLEVGSAEIFRSEVIDYAGRIWASGGDAELHVWSGGFHGFAAYPHAAVTQGALAARTNWLARRFGRVPAEASSEEESTSVHPAS